MKMNNNVIKVPFENINYRYVSSLLTKYTYEQVLAALMGNGYSESVAKAYMKQSLKRGWGS